MKLSVKRRLLAAVVSVSLGSTAAIFGWPTSSATDSKGLAGAKVATYDPAALPPCCPFVGGWEQLFMGPGR